MSLKTEIDKTETTVNTNFATAITNIDNKLTSLGGQKATNLKDVPNKIQNVIDKNYVKTARINYRDAATVGTCSKRTVSHVFKVPCNLPFTPDYVEGQMGMQRSSGSVESSGTFKYVKGKFLNSGAVYNISTDGRYTATVTVKKMEQGSGFFDITAQISCNGSLWDDTQIYVEGFSFSQLPQ